MRKISLVKTTCAIVLGTTLLSAHSQNNQKAELIRQCVRGELSDFQRTGPLRVEATGEVTCPAGDIVGFPPRLRTHDRGSVIVVKAGEGRVLCPDSIPIIENESNNGGTRGNFDYNQSKTEVSMSIGCNGAQASQGRRWYKATLVATSCPMVTQEVVLNLTLRCAERLN